jgi:hypothetical protein
MRVTAPALLLALTLSGCITLSHDFYLMGRTSGVTGSATVPANGQHGGPITITLGKRVFQGRWVYAESGGAAGIATATGYSGAHTATATGTAVGLPTGGNGTVLAAAADGTTLRCTFYFSEWNLKGTGVCQDNKGETYDLQIS